MSELRADTITASDGTSPVTLTKQSAAKAWANIDGTGPTIFRDSFNFSSLTDVGTGRTYPITFTNSMSNDDYAGSFYTNAHPSGEAYTNMNNNYAGGFGSKTTSSFGTQSFADGLVDSTINDVLIMGDLA